MSAPSPSGLPLDVSIGHAIRLASARLKDAGVELEAHDFFGVVPCRDGFEVKLENLSDAQRVDLALIRDGLLDGDEEADHLPRHDLVLDVLRRGGDQALADALAQIHHDLQSGDMKGVDLEDLKIFLSDDKDHINGFLDDIEARLGVNVDAARELLLPGTRPSI